MRPPSICYIFTKINSSLIKKLCGYKRSKAFCSLQDVSITHPQKWEWAKRAQLIWWLGSFGCLTVLQLQSNYTEAGQRKWFAPVVLLHLVLEQIIENLLIYFLLSGPALFGTLRRFVFYFKDKEGREACQMILLQMKLFKIWVCLICIVRAGNDLVSFTFFS